MKKILLVVAAISLGCQKSPEVQPIRSEPSPSTTDSVPSATSEPKDEDPSDEKSILTRFNPSTPQFFNGPVTLEAYLAEPIMHEAVHALWKKGFVNYAPDKPLGKLRRESYDETGAGRTGDWINSTFDESEDGLVVKLKQLSPPPTWTIQEIDAVYEQLKKDTPPDEKASIPHFIMVKGFNVNYLPDMPLGNNAIVQLASQYNYLEAPGPTRLADVKAYLVDETQGPQGVIEALAATIYRDAMVVKGALKDALEDILPASARGKDKYYNNGYLEATKAADQGQINNLLTAINTNLKELRILPQWVMTEASGATELQVFSAAPSFQGTGEPAPESPEAKVCIELVSAQYEAIGKLAVIRAIKTGQEVPVHLTFVGQGVFNNPSIVMTESFKKIARVVKGYNKVKIFVHAFGEDAKAKFEQAYLGNEGTFTKSTIDKLAFAKLPAAK